MAQLLNLEITFCKLLRYVYIISGVAPCTLTLTEVSPYEETYRWQLVGESTRHEATVSFRTQSLSANLFISSITISMFSDNQSIVRLHYTAFEGTS